ncbi:MAG: thioredoxin family protein [Acidobacteria bacterium]|nr:thioredoxin family protein [Acidobacteriota bacterium]
MLLVPLRAQEQNAFRFQLTQENVSLYPNVPVLVTFTAETDPGYYLYSDMYAIRLNSAVGLEYGEPHYPEPKKHYDQILNEEKLVYAGTHTFAVPVTATAAAPATGQFTILVDYQGCSPTTCFLPDTREMTVSYEISSAPPPEGTVRVESPSAGAPKGAAPPPADGVEDRDFWGSISSFFNNLATMVDQNLQEGNFLLAFLLIFFFGIGTSFTPCVYPVIPITVSIFGARGAETKLKGFLLSLIYAQGIGVMYGGLGLAAALAGTLFGQHMSNPWVVGVIALIFIVLGLFMSGILHFNLPSSLQTKASQVGGRGYLGAFSMGLVSGVIMAPCTGPVLLGILTWISTTRDVMLGFLLCYVYAMGIGLLFIILGTFSSLIAKLPKSGEWMDIVKGIFAVVMFLAALYFLKDVYPVLMLPSLSQPVLWIVGILLIVVGFLLKGLKVDLTATARPTDRWRKYGTLFMLTLGFFMLMISLVRVEVEGNWRTDLDQALADARAQGKPAVVDFTATWCNECKKLDKITFSDPRVQEEFRRFVLIKVDLTRASARNEQLQATYDIKGLPLIVFHDSAGRLLTAPQVVTFVEADEFLKILQQVN